LISQEYSVYSSVKSEIEQSIINLVEKFKRAMTNYLQKKQSDLTMCALDALSISVLDREEYWREKTARDVEKLHALRLQEVLNEVPAGAVSASSIMYPDHERKILDNDLSLSMWIDGISSPGSSTGASQRHRNILTHSPGSTKSDSSKRKAAHRGAPDRRRGGTEGGGVVNGSSSGNESSRRSGNILQTSSPREGFLRIRDINSSNILHDNTIDVAPVALGVGGAAGFSDDEEDYCDVSNRDMNTPLKGGRSSSAHSAQEYFTQAHR
jgi:hypothetical protein